MFGGNTTNTYDDIVGKTTDENLTSENWELILNLCDKVVDEGQDGARTVIAAILKRLAHRNPNVQLYALSLAEALSKNCGVEMNREIASKAFTQGLEKLITDRNTHDKVKKRALVLISMWTADFENDTSLGVMEDCYNTLKGKGFKFETPQEPVPPTVDDEIRRKEEEELQRVLELSMQDKGGRGQWSQYSLAASSSSPSAAQPTATPSNTKENAPSRSASLALKPQQQRQQFQAPTYQGGYVPAKTPSPSPPSPVHQQHQPYKSHHHHSPTRAAHSQPQPQRQPSVREQPPAAHSHPQPQRQPSNHEQPPGVISPTSSTGSLATTGTTPTTITPSSVDTTGSTSSSIASIITRVRALHTFEPTEPGELPFEKGDIIRVVDRGYKDWWRGQLKGRTGIFPVNYVEPMPEPTAADMARETEQEAAVFSQAVNVEKLLSMLRNFDPQADNLADNEEIQELYRSCMALRPKIVKLIDKYSQKRADLVSMNETFIRARAIFDQMMEDSLARHTASIYDSSAYRSYAPPAVDPRARVASPANAPPGSHAFGWNSAVYDQPGYNMYSAPAATQHPQHDPSVGVPYSAPTAVPTMAAGNTHADSAPQYGYVSAQGGYHTAPYPGQGLPAPYAADPGTQPTQQTPVPHQQLQAQAQSQPQVYHQDYQQQPQGPVPAPYAADPGTQPTTQQAPAPYQQLQAQAQTQSQPQVYRQDYQQQPAHAYSPQAQTQAAPVQAAQPQHVPIQQYPSQPQQQQPQQLSPDVQLQALPQIHSQPQQQHLTIDTATVGQVQQAAQPQPQPQLQQQQMPQGQGQPQGQVAQVGVHGGVAQSHQTQAQVAQVSQSDNTTTSPQSQTQAQPQQQTGPPYAFDPYTTYADPNVQAWAQYYAQGGKDPAGAVYFLSVPGVTDEQLQPQPQQGQQGQQQQGQQGQGQQQQQQSQGQGQDQFGYQQNQDASSTASLTADGTVVPIVSVGATSPNSTSSPSHAHPEQYPAPTESPGSNQRQRVVSQSSYSSLANAASGTAVVGSAGSPGRTVHGSQQPSWLLPRRTAASPTPQASVPAAVATSIPGGYPAMDPGAGVAGTQPYHVLSNQFAGMSIAEQQ
ncbi:hypothetical protein JOM56_006975 [Amanita muscaria]